MVKVGFIVEGDSETILVKSELFQHYLNGLGIESSPHWVINAKTKATLYHPHGNFTTSQLTDVNGFLDGLSAVGVAVVFILLDRDSDDACLTEFKSKVYHRAENIVVVAVNELEAWYLADTAALEKLLRTKIVSIPNPESFPKPIEEIIRLMKLHRGRGVTDKKILTRNMIQSGFSLAAAATHPACPSAAYFHRKLMEAASQVQVP